MKRKPLTLTVAFVLILIFVLMLFVYQVRKSEAVIVTFFGKIAQVNTNAGPGLRLPFPIEKVFQIDERIQNFQDDFDEIKLPDQNIIFLSVYVGYRISDPAVFFQLFANGSISEGEKSLTKLVRNAKGEVAGRHNFSDFISTDKQQMKFTQIEEEILDSVRKRVQENHLGVEMQFLHIQKIALPESVTVNVFDRMRSERQTYISKVESDGELQSTKIRSEADSTAAKLLADADAQAKAIQGEGEAQMMKSLEVLQQNPGLATFNMQISAMEQFLQKKTTLILDTSTSPLQWMKLDEPARTNK